MTASVNALRESLSSGMELEVAALAQVAAQAVATLAADDGSTVSHTPTCRCPTSGTAEVGDSSEDE